MKTNESSSFFYGLVNPFTINTNPAKISITNIGGHVFRKAKFGIIAAIFAATTMALPVGAATDIGPNCAITPAQLVNGGFEEPSFGPNPTFGSRTDDQVPGWKTTASDHRIEFWTNGYLGIPSARNNQFVELNANEISTLYQDVATTPGEILNWELAHRGRNGVDTMNVVAGPIGGPYIVIATLSDDNSAWVYHDGAYTVPAGQTTTRYGFQAVSSAGGNLTQGNFLDDISFGTPACVQVSISVVSLGTNPVTPGDQLRYKITVRNIGGEPARGPLTTSHVPSNTTFVSGSLRSVDGYTERTYTDAIDGDGGAIESDGTVRFLLGHVNSAGQRTLEPGESEDAYFTVKTSPESANTTIANNSYVQYADATTLIVYDGFSQDASIDVGVIPPAIPGVPDTGRR